MQIRVKNGKTTIELTKPELATLEKAKGIVEALSDQRGRPDLSDPADEAADALDRLGAALEQSWGGNRTPAPSDPA